MTSPHRDCCCSDTIDQLDLAHDNLRATLVSRELAEVQCERARATAVRLEQESAVQGEMLAEAVRCLDALIDLIDEGAPHLRRDDDVVLAGATSAEANRMIVRVPG